jgi:hypothetical protein
MSDLRSDPRWLRLTDPHFTAAGFRGGIFELDIDRPAAWTGGDAVTGEDEFDPDNFLSADYCIVKNQHFFLRVVSEIQIQGSGGKMFYLGCWAEVSTASFNAYVVAQEPGAALPPPMAGAYANRLPGFPETLGQACTIRPRDGTFRPLGLLDFYKACGNDMRPALALTH